MAKPGDVSKAEAVTTVGYKPSGSRMDMANAFNKLNGGDGKYQLPPVSDLEQNRIFNITLTSKKLYKTMQLLTGYGSPNNNGNSPANRIATALRSKIIKNEAGLIDLLNHISAQVGDKRDIGTLLDAINSYPVAVEPKPAPAAESKPAPAPTVKESPKAAEPEKAAEPAKAPAPSVVAQSVGLIVTGNVKIRSSAAKPDGIKSDENVIFTIKMEQDKIVTIEKKPRNIVSLQKDPNIKPIFADKNTWIPVLVNVEGEAEPKKLWVSKGLVKDAKTTVTPPPPPAEPVIAAAATAPITEDELRSMFDTSALKPGEMDTFKAQLATLKDRIKTEKLTFKQIDEIMTIKRKGFGGWDWTAADVHCLKSGFRDRGDNFDIENVRPELKLNTEAVEQAKAFMRNFVSKLSDVQSAYADKGVITREEAGRLGMSTVLFDLIDSGMVTGIQGDGKITVEEIRKFNETIDKYMAAFPMITDRNKVIELYKAAPSFEMQDLDRVINTEKSIENGGLGITITEKTTFKELQATLKPQVYEVVRAKLTGEKVGANVTSLCQLLSALPLISQMNAKTQKDIFGIDTTKTPLQRYEGEINEANILDYLRVKKEEPKAPQAPGKKNAGGNKKDDAAIVQKGNDVIKPAKDAPKKLDQKGALQIANEAAELDAMDDGVTPKLEMIKAFYLGLSIDKRVAFRRNIAGTSKVRISNILANWG